MSPEQEVFETFMREEMGEAFDLTHQTEPDMGDYVALDTEDCWKAWQARAALSQPAPTVSEWGARIEDWLRDYAGFRPGLWPDIKRYLGSRKAALSQGEPKRTK